MTRPLIIASLILAIAPVAAQARPVFLIDSTVVRTEPSRSADRLGRLAACTRIEVRDAGRGWLALETAQGTAFVPITATEDQPARCLGGTDDRAAFTTPTPPATGTPPAATPPSNNGGEEK